MFQFDDLPDGFGRQLALYSRQLVGHEDVGKKVRKD